MPNALRSRAWLLLAASITLQLVILRSVRVLKHDYRTKPEERALGFVDRGEPMGLTNLLSFSYDDYYFSATAAQKPWIFTAYILVLAFLFSFIGICASDFFCPNLSTIATYLGLSESTAGVTFLAFGNGSPDVFSTFAALKGGTFGLAIGELIGAASFSAFLVERANVVISIVVGSIALIRPFHVPRYAFLRDTSFFTCAVILLIAVLHDGRLTFWESGGMVALYILYVTVVVLGNWWTKRRRHRRDRKNDAARLLEGLVDEEPNLSRPMASPAVYSRASPSPVGSPLHRPRSLNRPPISHIPHLSQTDDEYDTPRAAFSLLGAIEFRDVVNSLRKSSSGDASPARSPAEGHTDDYFGNLSRVSLHRRSSSYNPVSPTASSPATPRGKRSRKRAASHLPILREPMPTQDPSTEARGVPPPGSPPGSPETNPWTDHVGYLTPSLAPPSPGRPLRPQIDIPKSHPSHISIPTISVIDPTGHAAQPDPSAAGSSGGSPVPHESKFRIRRRIRIVLHVLFPSMRSFRHKSILGMAIGLFAVPAVLLLTVTLPVVDDGRGDEGGVALPTAEDEPLDSQVDLSSSDDEEDERRLSANVGEELHHLVEDFSPMRSPLGRIHHSVLKRASLENLEDTIEGNVDEEERKELMEEIEDEEAIAYYPFLTAAQCVLGPLWCTYFIFQDLDSVLWILLGIGIASVAIAGAVLWRSTDGYEQPWRLVRCFCGFISAMIWIAAIADEVVSVLQTIGEILGLSDAIIGLTSAYPSGPAKAVFAVGNSLADLVANVTVAQFAPAMAYAACFGGPMLNLLLGVGGSGTYHMFTQSPEHKPVQVNFSPTLWVSAAGLVLMLVGTAIFVPLNGYRIDRRWACCLIVGYIILMCVNVGVELKTGRD